MIKKHCRGSDLHFKLASLKILNRESLLIHHSNFNVVAPFKIFIYLFIWLVKFKAKYIYWVYISKS